MITVIGLGVNEGDLTKRGETALLEGVKKGAKVFVRTANTLSYQTVVQMGIAHTSLDYVYERSRSFSTLSKNLAKAVLDGGEEVIYLVDGSATEDNSVKVLLKNRKNKVEVIDGVSKITALVRQAEFSECSYTAISAYEIPDRLKEGSLSLPLLVYDIDDSIFAGDIKLLLGNALGEETKATYLCGGKSKKISLYELDRQKTYDYTSAVAIKNCDLLEKNRFNIEDLKEIIVRLRKPDGCPWDRVQTSESIKMSAVEEAYELVDAIDLNDDEKILEETGDIMLQAVFHAVLKEETGVFDLTDVITGICQKLISRHTHVFGKDSAQDEGSALSVWEKNKMEEKGQDTFAKAVNDVPNCFPAVMRAQKVGKRAGKAGMDFASVEDAVTRLKEEIEEFCEAYKNKNEEEREKELGDILFSAVNVGRKAGCDCEKALKESTQRFAKRFTLAEENALKEGKDVTTLSQEEWDSYYVQAKSQLKE